MCCLPGSSVSATMACWPIATRRPAWPLAGHCSDCGARAGSPRVGRCVHGTGGTGRPVALLALRQRPHAGDRSVDAAAPHVCSALVYRAAAVKAFAPALAFRHHAQSAAELLALLSLSCRLTQTWPSFASQHRRRPQPCLDSDRHRYAPAATHTVRSPPPKPLPFPAGFAYNSQICP